MSWQAYVDTSLIGTGTVDKAAIFNSEGTSVWASSPGFTVAPEEIKAIIAAYTDKGDKDGVKAVQSTGFHVHNERFVTTKCEDRSLYGRKGKEGVVIVKTNQAIIVAHYPDTVQIGQIANTVEQLADYLVSVGY
ncbi:MAG: hypothetical protein M1825_002180 [Sarcosagium campestre]|nr:MAG: hypothetical protein M1825_002180 [Sarcosagium campestre]